MIVAIAARLKRLPIERLREIIHPVADWMERIAERLYKDAAPALGDIWDRIVEALGLADDEERRHREEDSWADDSLNSPVGKLVNLVMKDPTTGTVVKGGGFPSYWSARLAQLLALPGDKRHHALVMIAFRLVWLFQIDPTWTEKHMLYAAADSGNDGDALWDGIFWAARFPSEEIFRHLKAPLLRRALSLRPRRHHSTVMAGFLLIAWAGGSPNETDDRAITDIELRDILIHSNDDLRSQLLWHFERCLSSDPDHWRQRLLLLVLEERMAKAACASHVETIRSPC